MKTEKTNLVLVTIAIFVATFMTAIEGTIVSTAMPTIIGSLNGISMMNWVFSIYLLTSSIATPIYGKLSDRMGRKPIFIVGLVIFLIGSTLAGLSDSMMTLILARALQGIGAGAIQPMTFTMIADIYPFEKRAKVLGLNGSAWGIASIIAPLLGGYIVQHLSWHWIFFINIPVGLITLLLVIFFFHETPRTAKAPIDYFGAATLSVVLLALMISAQGIGTANLLINGFWIVVAIVAAWLFVRSEAHAKDPLIPLALFKNRLFLGVNLVAALISGVLIGFEVYIPMWMQGILGLPASMGGFAVTPSSVMWIFGSFLAGRLIVEKSAPKILTWSLLIIGIGIGVLGLLPIGTPFWTFLLVAAFLGTGFGITITTTTVTAQNAVSEDQVGLATSLNTLSRTIGQTIMMSSFGVIQNALFAQGIKHDPRLKMAMLNKLINPETAKQIASELIPKLRDILLTAMHGVYWVGVVLVIIALAINFWSGRSAKDKA